MIWYGGADHSEERIEQTKRILQRLRETVSNSPRIYIDNTLSIIEETINNVTEGAKL